MAGRKFSGYISGLWTALFAYFVRLLSCIPVPRFSKQDCTSTKSNTTQPQSDEKQTEGDQYQPASDSEGQVGLSEPQDSNRQAHCHQAAVATATTTPTTTPTTTLTKIEFDLSQGTPFTNSPLPQSEDGDMASKKRGGKKHSSAKVAANDDASKSTSGEGSHQEQQQYKKTNVKENVEAGVRNSQSTSDSQPASAHGTRSETYAAASAGKKVEGAGSGLQAIIAQTQSGINKLWTSSKAPDIQGRPKHVATPIVSPALSVTQKSTPLKAPGSQWPVVKPVIPPVPKSGTQKQAGSHSTYGAAQGTNPSVKPLKENVPLPPTDHDQNHDHNKDVTGKAVIGKSGGGTTNTDIPSLSINDTISGLEQMRISDDGPAPPHDKLLNKDDAAIESAAVPSVTITTVPTPKVAPPVKPLSPLVTPPRQVLPGLVEPDTEEGKIERAYHLNFMKEALAMGQLALDTNETPVGCVLVYRGRIIAKGMNATNITRNGTRHAEFMALSALLSHVPEAGVKNHSKMDASCWGDVDPSDGHIYPYGQKLHPSPKVDQSIIRECVLYVTVEPCVMCASLLRQLRIKKVYFGAVNDKFGGTGGVFRIHLNSKQVAPVAMPGHEYQNGYGPADPERIVKGKIAAKPRDLDEGDGGNVEPGYPADGGFLRDEAVSLLRRFYVQENGRAPQPRKKEGRAARLYAMEAAATEPIISSSEFSVEPENQNYAESSADTETFPNQVIAGDQLSEMPPTA